MRARLIRDLRAPEVVETVEAATFAEVAAFAFEGVWPAHARAYDGPPSGETECTPLSLADLQRPLPQDCLIVLLPGGPLGKIFNAILKPLVKLFSFLAPKVRTPDTSGQARRGSPNNELGERVNSPRLGERIPDCYGSPPMTPDLLSVHSRFIGHTEVEEAYLCLSRGSFEIASGDVYDGDTPVEDIAGMQVEVYAPDTSPNSGSAQLTIGGAISGELGIYRRANSVNGQVLRAPNANKVTGGSNIRFTSPDTIEADSGVSFDFTDFFEAGDDVIVSNAAIAGSPALDLAGTYEINTVTADTIVLVSPASVNSDWSSLYGSSSYISPVLETSTDKWVGPHVIEDADVTKVLLNIVASSGLYGRDDGGTQYAIDVGVEVKITELDSGSPTGTPETFTDTIEGSAKVQSLRALTMECEPTFSAPFQVEVRRTTDAGNARLRQEEIALRDLYSVAPVTEDHFGDVTTILARTVATRSAQAVKERKLNLRGATRMLPAWDSETQTFGALAATNDVAPILCAMALDPYIGRRSLAEIDVDGIYAASAAAQAHFGSALATQVSITLDDPDQSFQEAAEVVAGTAFCDPYRDGPLLKLRFDGPETAAVLLLNHRSILPKSQRRAYRVGQEGEFDGVVVSYTDPADGTEATVSLPDEPLNPKEVSLDGVATHEQAWWHARREYARITYQAVSTELNATREAALLTRGARVLIADTTNAKTDDGEVLAQDSLTLTLSQPVEDDGPFVIWLNLKDGSVEPIDCTKAGERSVTLDEAPSQALVLEEGAHVRTTYLLTPDPDDSDDVGGQAFRVATVVPGKKKTIRVRATIDDPRVYAGDGVAAGATIGLDAATAAIVARMAVDPGVLAKESLDRFILDLGGILAKLDLCYLALHDAQASLLNLPDATFNATANGGLSFTPYLGFTADGIDDYLNTTYNCNSDATNYALNSASIMVWQSEFTEGDNEYAFGIASGEVQLRPFRDSTVTTQIALNSGSTAVVPIHEQPAGFWGVTRNDSAAMRLYYQEQPGILTFTDITAASTNLPTAGDLYVARRGANYSVMTFPFFALGSGLTAAEVQTVQRALAGFFARAGVYS